MALAPPRYDLDLGTKEFASNPIPTYRFLLEKAPVCQIADGTYAISKYKDVKFVLKNHELFSSNWTIPLFGSQNWRPEQYRRDRFLSEADPPEHTKHNAIINKFFISSSIADASDSIRNSAEQLAAHITTIRRSQDSEIDFLTNFSYPLAIETICRLIGIERSFNVQKVNAWINLLKTIPLEHPGLTRKNEIEDVLSEQIKIYDEIIFNRKITPRNDLASAIVNATINEDKITQKQVRSAFNLLLLAGVEAPAQTLARAILFLAKRKDFLELLRADSKYIPPFIEEVIRLGTSAQGALRTCTTTIKLNEFTIPAGARVLALIGAANRDPEQFHRPDEFQLSRYNIKSHIGFGYGAHVCIGSALARTEIRIAIEVLLENFHDFDCPAASTLDWNSLVIAHLLRALPIRFMSPEKLKKANK